MRLSVSECDDMMDSDGLSRRRNSLEPNESVQDKSAVVKALSGSPAYVTPPAEIPPSKRIRISLQQLEPSFLSAESTAYCKDVVPSSSSVSGGYGCMDLASIDSPWEMIEGSVSSQHRRSQQQNYNRSQRIYELNREWLKGANLTRRFGTERGMLLVDCKIAALTRDQINEFVLEVCAATPEELEALHPLDRLNQRHLDLLAVNTRNVSEGNPSHPHTTAIVPNMSLKDRCSTLSISPRPNGMSVNSSFGQHDKQEGSWSAAFRASTSSVDDTPIPLFTNSNRFSEDARNNNNNNNNNATQSVLLSSCLMGKSGTNDNNNNTTTTVIEATSPPTSYPALIASAAAVDDNECTALLPTESTDDNLPKPPQS